jgi:hypothetical protein
VSELTAKEALVSLFDSDASPMEVADPERLAEVVVQWLIESGFRIMSDDRARAVRAIHTPLATATAAEADPATAAARLPWEIPPANSGGRTLGDQRAAWIDA